MESSHDTAMWSCCTCLVPVTKAVLCRKYVCNKQISSYYLSLFTCVGLAASQKHSPWRCICRDTTVELLCDESSAHPKALLEVTSGQGTLCTIALPHELASAVAAHVDSVHLSWRWSSAEAADQSALRDLLTVQLDNIGPAPEQGENAAASAPNLAFESIQLEIEDSDSDVEEGSEEWRLLTSLPELPANPDENEQAAANKYEHGRAAKSKAARGKHGARKGAAGAAAYAAGAMLSHRHLKFSLMMGM